MIGTGMAQSKSLIIGASGQVGTQMLDVLGAQTTLATSRVAREGWLQLDLAALSHRSQASEILDPHLMDAIYCVGGMTHVDGCETEPDMAQRTNARGPGVLAAYAYDRNLPFVYFSTEYLFDGSKENAGPYPEDAEPNPLNAYGNSKLAGEQAVLAAHPKALVLRTTVVYGPDPRQKNYMYSLMRNLSAGIVMHVPEDQISTPTYNRDLIHAALGLVQAGASGIFHVCGPELLGRLEFAQQVAAALGLDGSLLQGVTTQKLGQTATRPLMAGLATSKLRTLYPRLRMKTLSESLEDCREELQQALKDKLVQN
jgi:dTDP-4-dehydrorhamnose reductase